MSPSRSWRCCMNAPEDTAGREGKRKARTILAELAHVVQPLPHLREAGAHGGRAGRLRCALGPNRYGGWHAGDDLRLAAVAGAAPLRDWQPLATAGYSCATPSPRPAEHT